MSSCLSRRATGLTWLVVSCCVMSMALAAPLTAQQGRDVTGRIVEADGTPIAGATVSVVGTNRVSESDAGGRFLITGLTPGTYQLGVERLGYEELTTSISVGQAATVDVRIVLSPQPVALGEVVAIGSAQELSEVRRRLRETPGSVELVAPEQIRASRQMNLSDVLRFTPGVYVQPRFGAADESQLSIRGSGLRNNFHLRGVNVLVNGMPYRNADGFTDFESLELLTTENIQVYKAANALRYGGSTLGGAINLETKTGYTSPLFHGFAQGGSFGLFKGQLSSGRVLGDFNYYTSYARTDVDGYRDYASQRRDRINVHVGYRLSPAVDARAFYLFAYVEEDLPGSLTRAELERDPTMANTPNVLNRWGRDYSLHHLGLQLRAQLSPTQRVELAPYLQYRDIVHPIFRVLDQISRDFGSEIRYESTSPLAGRDNRLTIGLQGAFGNMDNRHFQNVGGTSGALAKDQRDEASTLAVYAEDVLRLSPRLRAALGVRYDRSARRAEDFFLSDGDQSDDRTFAALMPKLGLIVDLPAGGQLYGNLSRAFEPPLLLELNSLTVPGFIDLEPQDAWQFELGTRGAARRWEWDVAAFDMEIANEIINVNVQPFPGAPFTVPTYRNATHTRHYGLEAGLGFEYPRALLTRANGGDRLTARTAYTASWFKYVDDADFEGNDIPGAPHHVINVEPDYRHPAGLGVRPNLEWVPRDYYVNSQNTVKNSGWMVLGLRAELLLPSLGALLFVEARNLTDERYSPAVTVDDAGGRYFLPADGRSLYAGVRWEP
ncbi:MAG: TonB-dependent receptor [Gemmatimonadetes bacterium]|nr:TonB-dependent receptor [Gemmatimonadota bacterium]